MDKFLTNYVEKMYTSTLPLEKFRWELPYHKPSGKFCLVKIVTLYFTTRPAVKFPPNFFLNFWRV